MIHSINMFNLLAQNKPRIKIKMSAYNYIPVFTSKCECLLPLPEVYFISLLKEPAYEFINSTISNSLISAFIYLLSLFLQFFCYLFSSYLG